MTTSTVYKIRHIPSTCFYRPIADGRPFTGHETNLHKDGKIYHRKPTLEHISNGYNDLAGIFHEGIEKKDWEIVAYDLVERK